MDGKRNYVPLGSQRVMRTPPGTPTPNPQKQDDSTVVDPNLSSCRICDAPDTSRMVQCDNCKGWHHFECVGVTAAVANAPWQCPKCAESESNKEVQQPVKAKSTDKGGKSSTNVPPTEGTNSKSTAGLTKQGKAKVQQPFTNVPQQPIPVESQPIPVETQPTPAKSVMDGSNKSIRSHTSSKQRRSVLILERLTKEREIQAKMIEAQARVETEFLQKEYAVLVDMEESDEEVEVPGKGEEVEKTRYVEDWLKSASGPTTYKVLMEGLGATDEQMWQKVAAQMGLSKTTKFEGTDMVAPRQVLPSQPPIDFINNPIEAAKSTIRQVDRSEIQFIQPAEYEVEQDTQTIQNQAEEGDPTTQQKAPKPDLIHLEDERNLRNNADGIEYPSDRPINRETTSTMQLYPTVVPDAVTPIQSQLAAQVPAPIQRQSTAAILGSQPFPIQPQLVPMSVQQSTPISIPQYTTAQNYQQSMAQPANQIMPPSLNPRQAVTYSSQPFAATSTYRIHQSPSSVYNVNPQQPVTVAYSVPIPTSQQQHVTSAYQQLYAPMSSYQPPTMSSTTHNASQLAIGGLNNTFNVGGYGPPLPQAAIQSYIYDPHLNPQQLQPNRLQLAARQTMPKDYPKFNGDPEKWSIFYNAYANCTVTCGLSNGENLHRIERCLEDPARKAVKNLLSRPEAVPDVIDTLKMLYGRPEASIEAQIQIIRNEPPPKMNKIDFSMAVRNVTNEIERSGMWQYLWDPRLLYELAEKLPYQMRLEWGQMKMLAPDSNLSSFSNWLFARARTACAITLPGSDKRNNKSNPNHVNSHLKSNDPEKKANNMKSCQVCNTKSHDTRECRKFTGMSLSDRWETVKLNKICRICLGNHPVQRCESKSLCGESGCTIKHHRLLHNPTRVTPVPTTVPAATTSTSDTKNNIHSAHQQNKLVILRRYIPVTLYGPNGSLRVIAFLDEGSDTTLVENWVVNKLGITGTPAELFLKWTAKIERKEPNSQSVSMEISGTKGNQKQYAIRDARTVKSLDLPSQSVNTDQLRDTYKFLRRIPIESYTNETPRILLGLSDCRLITPNKVRSGGWDEPIATKTLLGWEIHGANASSSQIANLSFHSGCENSDENLHRMIENFFSLDNFGVKKPEQTVEALSDKRARQQLESTTKRIGNRFETGLLWKYDDVTLPDSLPMAKRRLESLERRLQKDPDLALAFRSLFHEYIAKGYVRKLNAEEVNQTNGRIWYLPLFPITNPKKPGKIRLVWDAAAKVGNVSLNSMLMAGPDLLVPLPGVLYRFRERACAVAGDIKEMFHQAAVCEPDQTSQRFLWKEKGSSTIEVYVLLVLSFGSKSSPASAQYVKNKNASEFIKQYPRAEEAIRRNTYVDDWLQSFDTETEAERISKEVRYVHSQGGFEIRNWLSSSPNVCRSLGVEPAEEQKLSFDHQETQTERVLGMWWNVKSDTFTYSLRYNPINKDILFNGKRPTKREALRTLMTVYDPIGLLASYLVQLKMILQDIWRTGIGWDEQIKEKDGDDLYNRWLNWIKYLPDIERISIKRHYSSKIRYTNPTKIELHVFTDAGDLAYATVAYFRIEDQEGVDLSLIGGKTKVAPLRPLSMPRMELQAAVLGSRLKNSIIENHTIKIERVVMWTDSSTVLSWLRSDLRRYTQFVGARVCEILETTNLVEWRWVPSNMNPADDATKYKTSFNLDQNNRWFQGPEFLQKAERFWPSAHQPINTNEELRPKYINIHSEGEKDQISIKFENFSQWRRTMAFVLRYINNLKANLRKPGFVARCDLLSSNELKQGENVLLRMAQRDEFELDIRQLEKRETDSTGRRSTVNKNSAIYRYSPYLDSENILRMKGRIDAAYHVSFDQKRPIILPTNHQVTEMIVKEYHSFYKHQYTETVINEIKQKFVIPRLRALLKKVRRNCQHCKNTSVQPKAPQMAQLPEGRLASFNRVYTFVGIDYAGAYMVTSFRRTVKRWIVIFTCLTVRAVHIDCVETLTTDSCIMAIRRFVARYGPVEKFFSDRGTNFVGANNELRREVANIDHDLLNVTFTNSYTQWHFNPPYGQHMGGAWERLIGSMKKTLDKILPKSHYPNQETFTTALAEVENIMNSRPLTFVTIEAEDNEALTPNHFIKGSSNGIKPPGIFPPLPKTLRGNWRYAQQIANEFWNKWLKEYLPMITRRTKWFEDVKPVEVGDQVIIVDEDAPRNMWERGVVIEATKSGRDGRVREARVRTVNGVYARPVSKLAVLDLEKAKTLTRETLAGGSVAASSDS